MTIQNENEAYAIVLCMHLRTMVARLRQLAPPHWDWTPDPAAPTARILATHTWQWLICDRQHIGESDARKHDPVPEPPTDTAALCDALAEETDRWDALIRGLTREQFDAPRKQFNGYPMNVRGFVCHMIQNSIYKNGQFATLFFALGMDGQAPYDAPFPNPCYAEMHSRERRRTEPCEEYRRFSAAFEGEGIPEDVIFETYETFSQHFAPGRPVYPESRLEHDFGLTERELTPERLVRIIAARCDLPLLTAPEEMPEVVTLADLVRTIHAATANQAG